MLILICKPTSGLICQGQFMLVLTLIKLYSYCTSYYLIPMYDVDLTYFLQTQGLPMGLPLSGYVATLSLGWWEFQFMDKLAKRDKQLAITLSDVTRYYDDICVTNFGDFDNIAKSIYPPELPLVRSTSDIMRDSFLDIDIFVEDGHFKVGFYNKTDHFDFPVITFSLPDSNMSTKVVYNCFYTKLVRFATLCTDLDRYFEYTNILYTKLVYRDYYSDILLITYETFLNNYSQLLLNNYGEIPKIKPQISSYVDSPLPALAFEVSTPEVETRFNIKHLNLDTPDTLFKKVNMLQQVKQVFQIDKNTSIGDYSTSPLL